MKWHGQAVNKSGAKSSNVTNRALRSIEQKYLRMVLGLQLLAVAILGCLGLNTQKSVFGCSVICFICMFFWSISLYLRKWIQSKGWYVIAIVPMGVLAYFFMLNLMEVLRIVSQSIPVIASCVTAIHETEDLISNIPCPEILAAICGVGGIIAYVCFVFRQQHSKPNPEWNPYTYWTIHAQRIYYLVWEWCALCAICYVLIAQYGYLRVAVVSLSIISLIMFLVQYFRDEVIAQDGDFPTSHVCRYLFDKSDLSHKYSEIEHGGQCAQVINAIVPLVTTKNEQHKAYMTVVCIISGMVQEHFRKVHNFGHRVISEKQIIEEAATYLFAIGVAGAMINLEYSEHEYKEYYEKRWRILFLESEKLNTELRGDLLFGFVCGICLAIVHNLNNGSTSKTIIARRIGIAKRMMKRIESHMVYLTGVDTELLNRGEKELDKKLFEFLQPNERSETSIVLDNAMVKVIFDAAANG